MRHLPEVDHPQHDGERRIELVADDLDERAFDAVGLKKLGVGRLELGQERVLLDDQVVVLDGLPHHGGEEFGVAGLGEIAEDVALVDCIDDGTQVGVGGEKQSRRFGVNCHRVRGGPRRRSSPAFAGRRESRARGGCSAGIREPRRRARRRVPRSRFGAGCGSKRAHRARRRRPRESAWTSAGGEPCESRRGSA